MDFARPLEALIPGAVGRVLGVLLNTSLPLSGRAIAQLAGVSPAQAGRVLPRLVDLGLAEAQPAPPATLYTLVPDHVAVEQLRALSGLDERFIERLGEQAATLALAPACVAVFGSFARREAAMESDIDLLIVRPTEIDEEDEAWRANVDAIWAAAGRLSGNRVEMLEIVQEDASDLIHSGKPLWRNIVRDGRVVFGRTFEEL